MYEQSQLTALINTAADGILSINEAGIVSLYNPAAAKIFGHPPENVIGQGVEMLMPNPHAQAHGGYIQNYLESGQAQIIGIGRQVEGLRADGSTFPLRLSVGEFEEEGRRFFVGIVRDLTAEIEEQRRTQELRAQLELIGRHAAVTEMGAALAHELNQPLTAIDLFLVAAERQLHSDAEKASELFARVRTEAERAGEIVRRIRQMVERSDSEKEAFPLSLAVKEAADLCRVVEGHTRRVETGALPEATVFGDLTQIRMILVNLIKNALDATAEQSSARILVRGSIDGMAAVEVLDNGPGVPEGFQDRLFEPFATTKDRGLGIGLSICSTIAEAHGGRLSYIPPDSQTDSLGGALFRLEVPLQGKDTNEQ